MMSFTRSTFLLPRGTGMLYANKIFFNSGNFMVFLLPVSSALKRLIKAVDSETAFFFLSATPSAFSFHASSAALFFVTFFKVYW